MKYKNVLLLGGPCAGQCVQLEKNMEHYTVEVMPKDGSLNETMLRAQIEASRVRYMISDFPLQRPDGDPLYVGLTDHRFQYNPVAALTLEYEKATLKIKALEQKLKEHEK